MKLCKFYLIALLLGPAFSTAGYASLNEHPIPATPAIATGTDSALVPPPATGNDLEETIEAGSSTGKSTDDGALGSDVITLVVVGDTGLNAHGQSVRPTYVRKHGRKMPWRETTRHIASHIDGDLNFMNLETIISSRNLRAENKTFTFNTHPNGARHLVATGFNLFSTANNHSMDYGAAGARDTLKHLKDMESDGLIAYPGLGRNNIEAGAPSTFETKGARLALSAIGITTRGFPRHRARANSIGQMSYQSREDYDDVTRRLGETDADYRILSIHYGPERAVRPSSGDIRKMRNVAVLERGADLVLGHHAHVAQGIEIVDKRLVLYGLGNFLHSGTANMARHGMCRDYGLLAKIHLQKDDSGRLRARAIEATTLTNMHAAVKPMSARRGRERVAVLNYLSERLNNKETGARGVRFSTRKDGTGLYCAPGSDKLDGPIGAMCKDWTEPEIVSGSLRRRIASSCGSSRAIASLSRERSGSRSSRKRRRYTRSAERRRAKRSYRSSRKSRRNRRKKKKPSKPSFSFFNF